MRTAAITDHNMVCSDGLYNEVNRMMPINKESIISPGIARPGAPTPCVLPETSFEEDRVNTRDLMRLSEKTLTRVYENEPDIYRVDDLKVRFR